MRTQLVGGVLASLLFVLPAAAVADASDDESGQAQALQTPPPGPPPGVAGAPPPGPRPPLRIFMDCYQCDMDYLRREVAFVDYVRDRSVADLHVLVTTQSTGGGGSSWTVKFIGLGRFAGLDRTSTFTTGTTATSDEQRKEFTRVFKLGLVGYAADTGPASRLEVTWRRPPVVQGPAAPAKPDPWKRWLFRTSASASTSGEASSHYSSYSVSFSGSRTTPAWKINLSAARSYNTSTYALGEGENLTSITESWNASGLVVKSLTGKWSWGTRGSVSNSSYSNTERATGVSSGIEFDFFPYSEIDRRSLTVLYTVGATNYRYRELTIFDKSRETVPTHSLNAALGLRQPWGSISVSTSFTQHLNHTDRWRASTYANADVRLFKGFSFYGYASYSKIKDQISLVKGGATAEEILLRLRQQATSYSFNLSFGFSYSFGSIFESVVNPRFGGSGMMFF